MSRTLGAFALCLLGWLAVPAAARAQADSGGGAGPSFLIARYASHSSLAMYSGYSAGPALVVVGMLHNPRTAYREVMAGVALPFDVPGGVLTLATAGASTNSGWYGQLYLMPSLAVGRLGVEVTAQLAEPLEARGARGVFVSPGNALVNVGGGFGLGAGYYASMEEGSRPYHGLGPALRRTVPHGSVTVEWIGHLTPGHSDEVRMTLRSSF